MNYKKSFQLHLVYVKNIFGEDRLQIFKQNIKPSTDMRYSASPK